MTNKIKDILGRVQKPGRYTAGEVNIVKKPFRDGMVRVALSYPDTYEIGMSYLGVKILYHLLNERDDVVCERVFAPWFDMEEELRKEDQKLFSLESRSELSEFDILGFSLSHEVVYTNVLNILDLGGISVLAKDRSIDEPIVIAGGECAYNPEPMSDFIDAFVVGDGEDVLPILIDEYKRLKETSSSREEILKGLAQLESVYVPSLYEAKYEDGAFQSLERLTEDAPEVIKKATVSDFENTYYPVKQIVPNIRVVHDRIAVEVMRGCPNKCRFCQASVVNRPVRVRSAEKVYEICTETYKNTGYERIALLSLSSVNYPYLTDVVARLTKDFKDRGVGISIPSLKVDEAFYNIPEMLSTIRKGGLTFAPESASEEVRKGIGKEIDHEVLCKAALEAYKHGWKRLKLYFMMGFPNETEDDIYSIIKVSKEMSYLKKETSRGPAEIKVSVNPFIPKSHTAFQWVPMAKRSELEKKRTILRSSQTKKVKIDVHLIDLSILEGNLARGDRRMGRVIYSAWKKGAKMDGWTEGFNYSRWTEALEENGFTEDEFACRALPLGKPLPWTHIKSDIPETYLLKELEKSGFLEDNSFPKS